MSVIFWARLSLMKRKLIPRLCFFWLVCLTITPIVRSERLPVKIYTSADGLGSSFVDYLMRDSRGFMWFLHARRALTLRWLAFCYISNRRQSFTARNRTDL